MDILPYSPYDVTSCTRKSVVNICHLLSCSWICYSWCPKFLCSRISTDIPKSVVVSSVYPGMIKLTVSEDCEICVIRVMGPEIRRLFIQAYNRPALCTSVSYALMVFVVTIAISVPADHYLVISE
jgi:hypothetical protein